MRRSWWLEIARTTALVGSVDNCSDQERRHQRVDPEIGPVMVWPGLPRSKVGKVLETKVKTRIAGGAGG